MVRRLMRERSFLDSREGGNPALGRAFAGTSG